MKKCIAIMLYLFLIVAFLGFDIWILFDIKQIFLVLIGTVIMYMPVLINNKKFVYDSFLFGQNALWASIIQTFVQLFVVMAENKNDIGISYNIALACRPLLYGFCIWVIFQTDKVEDKSSDDMTEVRIQKNSISDNVSDKIIENIKIQENNISNNASDKDVEDIEIQKNNTDANNVYFDAGMCRAYLIDMGLTKRETEVAMLVIQRMSNVQIASELYISETTVKKHMSNIFSKLNISRREQIMEIVRKM